jgi:hypothetical protein
VIGGLWQNEMMEPFDRLASVGNQEIRISSLLVSSELRIVAKQLAEVELKVLKGNVPQNHEVSTKKNGEHSV